MDLHEAMRQPNKRQFLQAMQEEVDTHMKNEHFVIVKRVDIPPGTKVLVSVWSRKRKRRIITREVYKWKARLNVHGGSKRKA